MKYKVTVENDADFPITVYANNIDDMNIGTVQADFDPILDSFDEETHIIQVEQLDCKGKYKVRYENNGDEVVIVYADDLEDAHEQMDMVLVDFENIFDEDFRIEEIEKTS